MRLVLDEHLSPSVAHQLRDLGHDVVTARELLAGPDRSDAELLRQATAAGRTVVTVDVADFLELHRAAVISGRRHAGVILVSWRRFSPRRRAVGRLVSALEAILAPHPDEGELDNQTRWLGG